VDVEKERISLGIKQLGGDPLDAGGFVRRGAVVTCDRHGEMQDNGGWKSASSTTDLRPSSAVRPSRDRAEQRPERFAVGDKVDARVTNIDKASRRVSVSIKALEMAEEKEAVEQYGSSDSGASLGDILGAALKGQDED
jgi:small subunit ribosomal protein S1